VDAVFWILVQDPVAIGLAITAVFGLTAVAWRWTGILGDL
jgi:hypothetical protein